MEGFDRHGLTIIQAWGMTETSPLGSIARMPVDLDDSAPDEQYAYRTRQGVPVVFVETRARGDDGELIPWDDETMGELEVRGPWVARAYHRGMGSEKFTDDGWFQTGDVVKIDERGSIRITDRSKDLVKSGGEWISSVDMENLLMGHPGVAEAAVVAVPDEKWDERPMAVVVLKEGAVAMPDDLREHLSSHFAKWQLPDRVEFIDEIPRTATGKFNKVAVREQFVETPDLVIGE
jgi:fatty-acyl-CoA synthase